MKSRMFHGFILAAVLAFASAVCGQTSNTIPYQETFEEMDVGSNIIVTGNTNGWYSGTNAVSAFVTNVSYVWTNVLHPVESAAHTKVLKFSDASLTNRFTAPEVNTILDFMVQPARSEAAPDSSLVTGCQTALYLDTNGLMNVWYGIDNTGTNNAWLTYANTPVGTADWVRVTVEFDYTTDASNSFFKVTLDGVELQPPTNGYSKGVGFSADPAGTWLLSANQTKKIQSFAAIGSGMLDDLVVKTAELYTTNGTPHSWLDQYGLTNYVADDVLDQDGDGLKTWQEYVAGTNPTNAASVLKVLRVTTDGSNDTVKWLSSSGVVYNLVYKTNLMNKTWAEHSNNIAPTVPTNTITLPRPGPAVFYKVTVTN